VALLQQSGDTGEERVLVGDGWAARQWGWAPVGRGPEGRMSHPVLRPNQMLIVCVPRNQVYTHTIQKMDT
jgi:hypothetical protein